MKSKLFHSLVGNWLIERTITPGGVFIGTATFENLSDTVLSYQEEGEMTLDRGTVLYPIKAYQWRLEEGQISIYFDDGETKGQLFHQLGFLSDHEAAASHWCDPDNYQSHYVFDLPQCFEITHEVKGPKKAYISKTIFKVS
ncbi:MAG: DUF6314 family protein [Pseudomonadota bacterium]